MRYDIFISYRRQGGSERAELLKAVFEKNGYPSDRIFMDTHTLKGGDFTQRMKDAIGESLNFIVLITKGCFDDIKDGDYFVYEISEAIRLNKNIVPVIFDGINSIEDMDLPEAIKSLPYQNAVSYNHEYANASYEKLCSFLVQGTKSDTTRKGLKTPFSKKNLFWFLGLLLLLFLCGWGIYTISKPTKNEQLTEKQIIDNMQASTMMLTRGIKPYATAFLVSENGLALTANHVLNSNTVTDSTYVFINNNWFAIKNIVCENPQQDYTLFRLNADSFFATYLTVASEEQEIGGNVWISSFDFYGLTSRITKGQIESIEPDRGRIWTSAKILEGFSGAPVCNQKGEAIGIALSCIEENGVCISSFAMDLHLIHSIVEAEKNK